MTSYYEVKWETHSGYFHGIVKVLDKSLITRVLYRFYDSNIWDNIDEISFTPISSTNRKVINLEEYLDNTDLSDDEVIETLKEKIPEYFI